MIAEAPKQLLQQRQATKSCSRLARPPARRSRGRTSSWLTSVLDGHRGLAGEHSKLSMTQSMLARDKLDATPVVQRQRGGWAAILNEPQRGADEGRATAAVGNQITA